MKEYINKDEICFVSTSEYMSSPISTIQDFNKCYLFLIKFLEEINNDELYSKGFLQIEGAVEKFLKCAVNNGYENSKEYSATMSIAKDLSNFILKYINESENFIDIVSYVIFKKNNRKKILKSNCRELFLHLFNKINTIYNEIYSKRELFYRYFDIFNFYNPSEIKKYESIDLLHESISKIDNDVNLNAIEKNKIISRMKLVESEINKTNPCLTDIFGMLIEIVIILKFISTGLKEKSSINEARDNILGAISIIETSCINVTLAKNYK